MAIYYPQPTLHEVDDVIFLSVEAYLEARAQVVATRMNLLPFSTNDKVAVKVASDSDPRGFEAVVIEVPGLVEEKYKGCVITHREQNHYDDSDFYAVVYNPETGGTFCEEYASTRYWCNSWATDDLLPEFDGTLRASHYQRVYDAHIQNQIKAYHEPEMAKGVRVTLTKAHTPRKGTQAGNKFWGGVNGTVLWLGRNAPYQSWSRLNDRPDTALVIFDNVKDEVENGKHINAIFVPVEKLQTIPTGAAFVIDYEAAEYTARCNRDNYAMPAIAAHSGHLVIV